MAHEEIIQAIEIIDKRIKTLMNLRQGLIDEFQIVNEAEIALPVPFRHSKSHKAKSKIKKKPKNEDIIIKLLREQGPQSRKEIMEKTGIPKGSVSGVTNNKEKFYSKDEKWHLVEDRAK